MKKFIAGILLGLFIPAGVFVFANTVIKSAEYNNTTISLNGQKIEMSQSFVSIVDEATPDYFSNYMPLREILEKLGYKVDWEESTRNVNISNISAPVAEIKPSLQKKTYEGNGNRIDYLEVSGMADSEMQKMLNEDLYTFFTWGIEDAEDLIIEADYAIVGNYLSVRAIGREFASDPKKMVRSCNSTVFDITTGEQNGVIYDYLDIDDKFREAVRDGIFKPVYPEAPMINLNDKLMNLIVAGSIPANLEPGFYLTDDSLGVHLLDEDKIEGDYWAFEAKYEDISDLLKARLAFLK